MADRQLVRGGLLAEALKREFGKHYVPDPRFPNLVRLLGLTDQDLLTLERLTEAVRASQYGLMQRSLFRHVGHIAEICSLLACGRLHTRLGGPVTTSRSHREKTGWAKPAEGREGQSSSTRPQVDREAAAIAILFKNPGTSIPQIAAEVGVERQTLNKMASFRRAAVAAGMLRPRGGAEQALPRGFRSGDGRVEAIDERGDD